MKSIFCAASILALVSSAALAQQSALYTALDADSDGIITQAELNAFSPAFTPTVYSELDIDGSGDIIVEEVGSSPLFSGFANADPVQFRRDAPLIVRRYSSYRVIDTNQDGFLSPGEVSAVIPNLTRTRYVTADVNADGVLDFNELYGWRHYNRLEDTGAILLPEEAADERTVILDRVRYTRIDLNGDGAISMSELARVAPNATLAKYAAIDANDDGVIVYRELYASDVIAGDIEKGMFVIPEAETISTVSTTDEKSYLLDSYTFALLDSDDDNLMSLAELEAAIPTISGTDFKTIDVDQDGTIRYDEFYTSPQIATYYSSGAITWPTARTISVERSYFTGIDRNRNGLIDADELMNVSPSVNKTVYTTVDGDGDGFVTYNEFYGSPWFTQAIERNDIITPTYVYRYQADKS